MICFICLTSTHVLKFIIVHSIHVLGCSGSGSDDDFCDPLALEDPAGAHTPPTPPVAPSPSASPAPMWHHWYARVLLLFSASTNTDTGSKSFDCAVCTCVDDRNIQRSWEWLIKIYYTYYYNYTWCMYYMYYYTNYAYYVYIFFIVFWQDGWSR